MKHGPDAPDQALRALSARWVWCGPGDLRPEAWVILQGGLIREVTGRRPSGVACEHLGSGVLLPGLVNAHTHLELSNLAGAAEPAGDFVAWLEALVKGRQEAPAGDAQSAMQAAVAGLAGQGAALVGDVTNTGAARQVLREARVSAVSFYEALGKTTAEPPMPAETWAQGFLRGAAVAAHAPYSVPAWRLRELKRRAGRFAFCLHLCESRAEVEFFGGKGPHGERLAGFLAQRGVMRQDLEITAPCPLQHALNLGLLDARTLAVHGAQFRERQANAFARSGASLCVCPRSNLGLTGSLAPVERLLALGVNLCLGTDSLASAPDLSLWREMQALIQAEPGLAPEAVLAMATLGGARALGQEGRFGVIAPGRSARLAFAPLDQPSGGLAIEALVHGEFRAPPGAASRFLGGQSAKSVNLTESCLPQETTGALGSPMCGAEDKPKRGREELAREVLDILHGLSQPLQALGVLAELGLMDANPGDPVYDDLASIQKQLDRLGEIVDQLNAYLLAEGGVGGMDGED